MESYFFAQLLFNECNHGGGQGVFNVGIFGGDAAIRHLVGSYPGHSATQIDSPSFAPGLAKTRLRIAPTGNTLLLHGAQSGAIAGVGF